MCAFAGFLGLDEGLRRIVYLHVRVVTQDVSILLMQSGFNNVVHLHVIFLFFCLCVVHKFNYKSIESEKV